MKRRVWITGMGLITPLGVGWEETWKALCAGRSGIRTIRSFDPTGLPARIAGEVPEAFDSCFTSSWRLRFPERYARFTRFALLASRHQVYG